jgi:hypothetical protein
MALNGNAETLHYILPMEPNPSKLTRHDCKINKIRPPWERLEDGEGFGATC